MTEWATLAPTPDKVDRASSASSTVIVVPVIWAMPHERLGENPVGVRHGVVGRRLRTHDETIGVPGGHGEKPRLGHEIIPQQHVAPVLRVGEISAAAGRLVERQGGAHHRGVIEGEARKIRIRRGTNARVRPSRVIVPATKS